MASLTAASGSWRELASVCVCVCVFCVCEKALVHCYVRATGLLSLLHALLHALLHIPGNTGSQLLDGGVEQRLEILLLMCSKCVVKSES